MYILALLGLAALVLWLSKSSDAQLSLVNSISSPFNTGDPEKADKKFGITNKPIKGATFSVTKGQQGVTNARLSNAAKFPAEDDFTPVSQHETYARDKGVVAVQDQYDTYRRIGVPMVTGDIAEVIVPGEKQQDY